MIQGPRNRRNTLKACLLSMMKPSSSLGPIDWQKCRANYLILFAGKRSYDLLDIAATDMTTTTEKKRRCAEDFKTVHEIRRRHKATAERMRKNGTLITRTFKKSEWERHVVAFEEQKKKEIDEELARIKKEMNELKQENNKSDRRSLALES